MPTSPRAPREMPVTRSTSKRPKKRSAYRPRKKYRPAPRMYEREDALTEYGILVRDVARGHARPGIAHPEDLADVVRQTCRRAGKSVAEFLRAAERATQVEPPFERRRAERTLAELRQLMPEAGTGVLFG